MSLQDSHTNEKSGANSSRALAMKPHGSVHSEIHDGDALAGDRTASAAPQGTASQRKTPMEEGMIRKRGPRRYVSGEPIFLDNFLAAKDNGTRSPPATGHRSMLRKSLFLASL
jgi:hypothetical protein